MRFPVEDDETPDLWPEAYKPLPGAREKDTVECGLRAQVCAGVLSFRESRTYWAAKG